MADSLAAHQLLARLALADGCRDNTARDIADPLMATFTRVRVSVAIDAMKQFVGAPVWPPALTPPLRQILGFMCFQLGPMAHAYQAAGEFVDEEGDELGRRAEDEQAFMLHRFLGYWFEHGDGWKAAANADLKRVVAIAAAQRAEVP